MNIYTFFSPFESTRVINYAFSFPFSYFSLSSYITDILFFFGINFSFPIDFSIYEIFTNNHILIFILFFFFPIIFTLFIKTEETINWTNSIIYFLYKFSYDIIIGFVKVKKKIFVPFFTFIFFFVYFSNLLGLIPFFYAITSHFSNTITFCILIWFSIITIGFSLKGISFLNSVLPTGIPSLLVGFLIFIETISYFFRFISLALRLFANIVAGHILIHVITSNLYFFFFNYEIGVSLSSIVICLLFTFVLTIVFFFEFVVAFLQSYIIIILSLIYATDATSSGH